MNVYFKSCRKSVPARGGSIRLSSSHRCKSLDLRPPTLHTIPLFGIVLAEFITFDPTWICTIERRCNKLRSDIVEIDRSQSIDLHTRTSIFSGAPVYVIEHILPCIVDIRQNDFPTVYKVSLKT